MDYMEDSTGESTAQIIREDPCDPQVPGDPQLIVRSISFNYDFEWTGWLKSRESAESSLARASLRREAALRCSNRRIPPLVDLHPIAYNPSRRDWQ